MLVSLIRVCIKYILKRGPQVSGVIMFGCGIAIVAMAIVIVSLGTQHSSQNDAASITSMLIIMGFWCGLPMIITGGWGARYLGIRRTRDTMVAFMIPCIITFFIAALQTINTVMEITRLQSAIRLFNALHEAGKECPPAAESFCARFDIIILCFLGLLIASIIGVVTSLIAAIISVKFYRTPLQEHPMQLGEGTIMEPPGDSSYPYVIGGNHVQISSSVQQPVNFEQGSCSQQPNTPQVETTRDDALLTA